MLIDADILCNVNVNFGAYNVNLKNQLINKDGFDAAKVEKLVNAFAK